MKQRRARTWWRGAARASAAAVAALLGGRAEATWTILLADTRTGEVVVVTTTCLTGFDLRPSTPVVVTGVGVATAQSFVEATGQNRTVLRDGLVQGLLPAQVFQQLQGFDASHQTRQYGYLDVRGNAGTFSGRSNGPFAGGRTGQVGDVAYVVVGNVITGACVLDAAAGAIEATAGPLGARALAGMEAARAMGGDGRCSCNADAPDSCGCPPPGSPGAKSSHIGVMIVARAGDEDRATAVYRAGASPSGILVADVTGDGVADVVCTNASGSSVSVLRNTTPAGAAVATFATAATISASLSPRAVAAADFSGDGLTDLLIVNGGTSNVTLVRGSGPGAFAGARSSYVVGSSPQAVAVGDVDGSGRPDALVVNQGGNSVTVLRNDGAGGLAATQTVALGAGASPLGIALGDVDGDGTLDAVVATAGRAALGVLQGDGAGGFTRVADVAMTGRPQSVMVEDVDGDGRADVVVAAQSPNRAVVLYREADGTYTPVGVNLGFAPAKVVTADVDGDGLRDLVARGQSTVAVVRRTGPRTFGAAAESAVFTTTADIGAGDLDGDGRPDVALTLNSINSVGVLRNVGGTFDGRAGTANGEHYFVANVANQQVSSPDPVFQLAEQYGAFLAERVGVVDAVASEAVLERGCVFAEASTPVMLTVVARDHTGAAVPVEPSRVSVEHERGSAGSSAAEAAMSGPGGSVVVPIRAGAVTGVDRLRVVIAGDGTPGGGSRRVVLMPGVVLRVSATPDWDRDGSVTPDDLMSFVACYFAAPPGGGGACGQADFNGDGRVDPDDASDYVSAYFGACE